MISESQYLFPDVRIDRGKQPNGSVLEPLILDYTPETTILAMTGGEEDVLI